MERYFNFGGEGMRAAARLGALAVLEVNAPVIDYPGSPKRLLDRALLVEPMRRWRDWQCRTADVIVSPSRGDPARRGCRTSASSRSSGAPTPTASARAPRARAVRAARPATWRPCSPARSGRGTARCTWSSAIRRLAANGGERTISARARRRRARSCRASAMRRDGLDGVDLHRGGRARRRCPRCSRPPTSASRRSTSRPTRRWRSRSTGRRSRCSSTWRRACPSWRPDIDGIRAHRPGRPRGRALRSGRPAARSRGALERLADGDLRAAARVAARARAVERVQLGRALRAPRGGRWPGRWRDGVAGQVRPS